MAYTPPVYPAAIPSEVEDLPDRLDDIDWLFAARYNELKKELVAALTELGTDPAGNAVDLKTRLAISLDADGALITTLTPTFGALTLTNNLVVGTTIRSGHIGIGAEPTDAGLTIVGAENTEHGIVGSLVWQNTEATVENAWFFRAGGAGTATPDGGFSISNYGGYRLAIDKDGNFGIGTITPLAKFHLDGDAIINTNSGAQPWYFTRSGAIDQSGKIYVDDYLLHIESIQDEAQGGGIVFKTDSNVQTANPLQRGFIFRNSDDADLVYISPAGNVGIGVLDPDAKLEVDGTLHISGAAVLDSTLATASGVAWDLGAYSGGTITAGGKITVTIGGQVYQINAYLVP